MPKDRPEQDKKAVRVDEVELVPDAWERFEKAVGKVAKSPPQPRTKKNTKSQGSAKRGEIK